MCTLTPRETEILINLIKKSNERIFFEFSTHEKILNTEKILFYKKLIDEKISNESHLEFLLLANNDKLKNILSKTIKITNKENFVKGRQIPISPFKPMQFDRADICLYNLNNPIRENSLPNIVIELKKDKANYKAYEQVTRYLRWLEQITSDEEFEKINAIIIAPEISDALKLKKIKRNENNIKIQ